MGSPMWDNTLQAAGMSAASNTIAQVMTMYQKKNYSNVDIISFIHFILFAFVSTPPNYWWQKWMEDTFPSRPTPSSASKEKKQEKAKKDDDAPPTLGGDGQLSIGNTAIKFVLDQTFGAAVNTLLFIVAMGVFKGLSYSELSANITRDFWPMLIAGYKVWPIVSIMNLTVVPFEYRMLVGNAVGLGWGVFISLSQL